MKYLQFFQNLHENLAIFSHFFEILSNFRRKFGEKFRNMDFSGVRGAKHPPPPTLANFLKSE